MSEVKRWAHAVRWESMKIAASYMAINRDGKYVLHDEYATLEAECDELRRQLANVFKGNTKLHVLWTEAAQQRDKLAGLLRDISSSESRGLDWAKKIDAALAEVE